MSFYDDASLVFLPSGGAGKDTKAYSIKPTNGDGDFTFSRGSNLTATRVDSNGLIEKGRENLLLQSNQFDTTWLTINASVTSGQSGYDGSTSAWLLTSTGGPLYQSISVSGVVTFSVYAKANSGAGFLLRVDQSTQTKLEFNISTGAFISGSNYIDYDSTSIGNGWYRLSVTFLAASTSTAQFRITNGSGTNISGSAYIQDAQLEQGLVATDYIESGATTGLSGILEDSPRFDYSGGASCPSLLLEPSRTNLIEYSEYFDGFSKSGPPTLTLEDVNSPEGVENVYSIVKRSAEDISDRVQQSLGALGTNHIFSIFLKLKSTTDTFNVRLANNQGERVEAVVSTNGTMVAGGATTATNYDIENYGNGWYRLWMETTTSATSNFYQLYPNITDTSVGKCYFYGAQVEEGSYPTSYIPNHSGGSVTREADSFEKTGLSSVIGQTEGTIFFEFEYSHQKINVPFFRVLEDASNLYEIIALSSFKLRSRARIGGSIVATIDTSSVVSEGTHKAAIIYKSGDYKFYLDGSLVGSSTESSIVSNPSEINYFDNNNNLKQFLIFPTALSDADCITLTS